MAINPMAFEAKETVLDVVRKERARFHDVVDNPDYWKVDTRCEGWKVQDWVGHMIDVTEGYLDRWEKAKKGEEASAIGLVPMAETLNQGAIRFRDLSRDDAIARLKAAYDKMMATFEGLSEDEWSNFMVTHAFSGPLPAFFYPAFHIMDYGVHSWDMRYGLGDKLGELDEDTAGLLVPFMQIFMQYMVDEESVKGLDTVYGIEISSEWGGKWRVTVKDGALSLEEETGNFEGCEALFRYTPSDFVMTVFSRFPGGSATGDPEVIERVRNLLFTI